LSLVSYAKRLIKQTFVSTALVIHAFADTDMEAGWHREGE